MKSFCNYHKHTSLSHRYNKDSPLVPMDYFKEYKVSLKSKIQSSQRFDDAKLKNKFVNLYNLNFPPICNHSHIKPPLTKKHFLAIHIQQKP